MQWSTRLILDKKENYEFKLACTTGRLVVHNVKLEKHSLSARVYRILPAARHAYIRAMFKFLKMGLQDLA